MTGPTLTYTPWSSCNIDNIKTLSQTTYETLAFTSDDLYEEWLNNLVVKAVEGHLSLKCQRDLSAAWSGFATYQQNALRDVVERLAVNVVVDTVANKVGKIVKVSDFNIQMTKSNIMTADIKELLETFRTTISVSLANDYATGNMQRRWNETGNSTVAED